MDFLSSRSDYLPHLEERVGPSQTMNALMFKVNIGFLILLFIYLFIFVLTRHFGSVLQNWAGMRCPYKLLRMILALVCSKLFSLTQHPVPLVILLLFMGGL